MPAPLTKDPERFALVQSLVEKGLTPAQIHRETGVTPPVVIKYFPTAGAQIPDGDWTDVPGWPEYAVTSSGLIRANKKINSAGRLLRARLLKPVTHPAYGHQLVYFTRNGATETKQLGRVVLETFGGAPPHAGMECCHGDGNPRNNDISNLRWGTHADNMQDMVLHGTLKREFCKRGHSFSGPNVRINRAGYRVCIACNRAGQRLGKVTAPGFQELADRIYESLVSGETAPTPDTDRRHQIKKLMEAGVSLSEIRRTTGADYRTVKRIDPDYRPFRPGGWKNEGGEIRETNRKLREFERKGRISNHRDAGFTTRGRSGV